MYVIEEAIGSKAITNERCLHITFPQISAYLVSRL